jgi:putative glutamine amidotransferase
VKKIAFTQRLVENESYPEMRDALDVRWAEFCAELHVLPVILPSSFNFREYFEAVEISGVVFTGGNDLYSVSKEPLSLKRDIFETSLLQFAIENNIPVLGVCRGMQLIADYFGATLRNVEGHIASKHEIVVAADCNYFESSSSQVIVNSYHSYAVTTLPECLLKAASSKNGIIEAIEHTHLPIAAQMWHPERQIPFHLHDLDLFKKIFNL